MLLRLEFHRYCEFIGRASAIVAFVSMTSLILAATGSTSGTSRGELRSNPQCPHYPRIADMCSAPGMSAKCQ